MIPSEPISTLTIPMKGRELLFHTAGMIWHLPFQGEDGRERGLKKISSY
jgi:hypothetical protein